MLSVSLCAVTNFVIPLKTDIYTQLNSVLFEKSRLKEIELKRFFVVMHFQCIENALKSNSNAF